MLKRDAREWGERASRLVTGGAGDSALADYYYKVETDFPRGLVLAQNAVRALPNDAAGINVLAHLLGGMGRMREALAARQRAVELDPLNGLFWQNLIFTAVGARDWDVAREALRRYRALGLGKVDAVDLRNQSYRIEGSVPSDLTGMNPNEQALWRWRARKFDECLASNDAALMSDESSLLLQVDLLARKALVLQRLGRIKESQEAAQLALKAKEKLPAMAEALDFVKATAIPLALLGRGDEAVSLMVRYIETTKVEGALSLNTGREVALAELYALIGRQREAVTLIGQLLRKPWGLSVSELKANPIWDSLRENAAFQALLANPENDKPFP